ncbi:MAG: hypothetical protein EA385_17270 [Salinarimonadaceae bacterium]|nr:MAG: hypothetical protein EA385_17270 [Salinarimonadaceae bacterium]
MIDLLRAAREYLYERALPTDGFLAYVRAHRLDLFRIEGFAGVAAATPIIDCGNARFDFGDEHNEAVPGFICEAFAADGETVIDLVAWPLDRPDQPMSMFGRVGLIGVAAAMNPATYIFDNPLVIERNPLDWLRSGCVGAAIVDPRVAAWELIDCPGRIAGQDQAHARQLLELAHSVIDGSRFVAPARNARAA